MNKARSFEISKKVQELDIPKAFSKGKFDVVRYLESLTKTEELNLLIVPDSKINNTFSFVSEEKKGLVLSEQIYDAACNDDLQARFMIAHEIGHLILHHSDTHSIGFGDSREAEANYFAECLLKLRK